MQLINSLICQGILLYVYNLNLYIKIISDSLIYTIIINILLTIISEKNYIFLIYNILHNSLL